MLLAATSPNFRSMPCHLFFSEPPAWHCFLCFALLSGFSHSGSISVAPPTLPARGLLFSPGYISQLRGIHPSKQCLYLMLIKSAPWRHPKEQKNKSRHAGARWAQLHGGHVRETGTAASRLLAAQRQDESGAVQKAGLNARPAFSAKIVTTCRQMWYWAIQGVGMQFSGTSGRQRGGIRREGDELESAGARSAARA
jgi:hypothetical protein